MHRLAGFLALTVGAGTCFAHEALQHFVHHTATFTVSEDSVDVAFDLVFYGEHAAAVRARMDTDRNKSISNAEWHAYKSDIAEDSSARVSILNGETSLATAALYEPEVELHGDWSQSDAPITVRLVFFAPRPIDSQPDLWVRDTLWIDMPALCQTRMEGGASIRGATPMTRVQAGEPREHRGALATPKKRNL